MNRAARPRIQSLNAMTGISRAAAIFLALFLSASLWAQTPNLEPRTPEERQTPIVTFEFVFAGAQPPHYSLSVEGSGKAAYRSDEGESSGAEAGQPYMVKFLMTPANAQRIFDLARELNFFKGDFEYRGGRVANMGTKTLTFKNGDASNAMTYNYSQNQSLQQLTTLFQGISNALEYRRKLERLYRYEKLGLEDELRHMEEDVKRNYIAELQVDESILHQIANDRSVMNISRKRAENILARIPSSETAEAAKP